ncbi:PREDICTED: uncharacterized protein LOC106146962 [Chinchilla lanigera]|uniref:uncharacterized protein LOC106146962 n=1 Tax=Chinchilla lanigera TaxID=34839 RepID=UPI000697C764|nr:PREDICTED: uncharacterized protein LOC106146962 [Chinchilla lanigera]
MDSSPPVWLYPTPQGSDSKPSPLAFMLYPHVPATEIIACFRKSQVSSGQKPVMSHSVARLKQARYRGSHLIPEPWTHTRQGHRYARAHRKQLELRLPESSGQGLHFPESFAKKKIRTGTAVFWKAGESLVAWSVSAGVERPPGVVSELEKQSVRKESDATLRIVAVPRLDFLPRGRRGLPQPSASACCGFVGVGHQTTWPKQLVADGSFWRKREERKVQRKSFKTWSGKMSTSVIRHFMCQALSPKDFEPSSWGLRQPHQMSVGT